MSVQISFENVVKTYRHNGQTLNAIDNLSFEIELGEFVGYAGPNGAGKSTSLKAMTGVLAVTSGHIRVRGVDPLRHRQQLARHTGTVFGQRSQMLWELSPSSYFEMVRALYRLSKTESLGRLDDLSDKLGLGSFIDQPVRTLSLGQRMRSELAAALLPKPEILFLDEPTIGLDLEAKETIRNVLRDLNVEDGTTVVLTTHDLNDIEALCSRLMIIDHGRLAYDGNIDGLYENHSPQRVVEFHVKGAVKVDIPSVWDVEHNTDRLRVTFDRRTVNATDVIRKVLSQIDVVDLRILEPDIEEVIGTIYRSTREQ